VRPLPDESASSLAFRLAQAECLSVTDFCRWYFDFPYTKARSDLDRLLCGEYASVLAHIAGISLANVQKLTLRPEWCTPTWDPKSRQHAGPVRVCPACLEQRLYGRRFWRTCFASVCPEHGLELTDRCPRCGTPLPYFAAPAGILLQFWLETWPVCPSCLRQIPPTQSAYPPLITMSRRWRAALTGASQFGLPPESFLRFSARLIDRFSRVLRYKQTATILNASRYWPAHAAAALLLNALHHRKITSCVFYAAIDREFAPSQLAKDIMV
jgi:hypothetical protein